MQTQISNEARQRLFKHARKIRRLQQKEELKQDPYAKRRIAFYKRKREEKKIRGQYADERRQQFEERKIQQKKLIPNIIKDSEQIKSIDEADNLIKRIEQNSSIPVRDKYKLLKKIVIKQKKIQYQERKVLEKSRRPPKKSLVDYGIQLKLYKKRLQELKSEQQKKSELLKQKSRELAAKYKNRILKSENTQRQPPRLIPANEEGKGARFAGVSAPDYETFGVQTLRQFYYDIKSVQEEHDADVKLYYEDNKSQKKYFTVRSGDIDTFENFEIRLGAKFAIQTAKEYGSDSALEDGYNLQMGFFSLLYGTLIGNAGKCDSLYYNTFEQPQDDKTPCFLFALYNVAVNTKNEEIKQWVLQQNEKEFVNYGLQEAQHLQSLKGSFEENGLIIYNFRVIVDIIDILNITNKKVKVGNKIFRQLELNNYIDQPEKYILYKNGHYECVHSFKKDLLLDGYGNICDKKGKILTKRNQLLVKEKDQQQDIKEIQQQGVKGEKTQITFQQQMVEFDFETVWDITKKGLICAKSIQFKIEGKCYIYFGDDCVYKFLRKLLSLSRDRLFVLSGYNSSRFDNFLLLQPLAEMDLLDIVFCQGNSILNMKIKGTHTVFDSCRFTCAPLKKVSQDFQLKANKKELNDEISFQNLQKHFNQTKSIESILHKKGCEQGNQDLQFDIVYDFKYSISLVDIELKKYGEELTQRQEKIDEKNEQCYEKARLYLQTEEGKQQLIDGDEQELFMKKAEEYGLNVCNIMNYGIQIKEKVEHKKVELQYINIIEPKQTEENMLEQIKCDCENYKNFCSYGLYDILSLNELYIKLRIVLDPIIEKTEQKLFDFKTIGSCGYKLFDFDVKDKTLYSLTDQVLVKDENGGEKIILPLLELISYKKTKRGLTAGRTQCYKGIYIDLSGKKRYFMLDIKSLYPYVMLNRFYPCGEKIVGSYEECKSKNLIGFFEVTFSQENMKRTLKRNGEIITEYRPNILPLRSEGKSLDWSFKGEITEFISTVDIEDLQKWGATIDKIGEGYYFSQKIHGKDLFKCQAYFKQIKEEQDSYKVQIEILEKKQKRTEEEEQRYEQLKQDYNPALREMAKLFLNALSGKVIENLHLDQYAYVKNNKQMDKVMKKCVQDPKIVADITNDRSLLHYKISEEDALKKDNRPIYLGCLIYAYARSHMYNSILAEYDVIYQDTDSALLVEDEYKRFISDKPDMIGSQFGDFELEKFEYEINGEKIKQDWVNKVVILAPKNYFLLVGQFVVKKGFKGIAVKNPDYRNCDKYMTKQTLVQLGFQFGKRGEVLPRKDLKNEDYLDLLYDMWQTYSNQTLKDEKILQQFIKKQACGESCYMLCSSLQKVLKNVGDKEGGNIYQRFMIKQIKIE